MAIAWGFEDQADRFTESVLEALAEGEGVVPGIWPLEVANVLVVAERGGILETASTARFIELLGSLPIVVEEVSFTRATAEVLSLARQLRLSAYDAAYLELAMRAGLPLATRDEPLRAACRASGVPLVE